MKILDIKKRMVYYRRMKELIVFLLLFPVLIFAFPFSFNTFTSDFSERIYDPDSTQIAEITGRLYIKKPEFLRMDVDAPQKQIMIVRDDSAMIMIKKTGQITYSQISQANSWLLPSNILFNSDSLFNFRARRGTISMIPRTKKIPLDSIIVNNKSPVKFMNIYTKDQVLKFSFRKQKTGIRLKQKLFLFPQKEK